MRETLFPPAPRAPAASALRSQRARPSWHACVGGTTSAGSSAAPGTPVRARHATNQRPCCTGATLCVATRLGQRVGARGGRKRREQRTSALAADCAQRARVRAHEPAAAAGQPEALRRAQRRALTARRHGRARRSRRGRLCSRGARARGRHQPNARSAPHHPRRAAWRPEPSAQLPRGCGAASSRRETGEQRGAALRGARGSLAHEAGEPGHWSRWCSKQPARRVSLSAAARDAAPGAGGGGGGGPCTRAAAAAAPRARRAAGGRAASRRGACRPQERRLLDAAGAPAQATAPRAGAARGALSPPQAPRYDRSALAGGCVGA